MPACLATAGAEIGVSATAQNTFADGASLVGGNGIVTRDTSIKYTGAASFKFNSGASGANNSAHQQITFTGDTSRSGQFRFYVSGNPAVATEIARLTTGLGIVLSVVLNTDGTISLKDDTGNTDGTTTATVSASTWYLCRFRADGTTISINVLGETLTGSTTSGSASIILVGIVTASTSHNNWIIYIDDVYVEDSGTAFPNEKRLWLAKATGDSQVGSWTGGLGGTSNLYLAVDNTPPEGTASETDTSQIERAAQDTGTTEYRCTLQTPTVAGVGSGTITAIMGVIDHGEDVGTNSKTGKFQFYSNPADGTNYTTFTFGDDIGALGTWPSNWREAKRILDSPSISKSTAIVIAVQKTDTGTRTGSIDFIGCYIVEEIAGATEVTKTFTTDAALRKALTKTHTTDAALRKAIAKTHTTDSYLVNRIIATFTSDAALRKALTQVFQTDALLRGSATKTHTTDAALRKALTADFTTDAALKKATAITFQTDAALKKAMLQTFTTDAALRGSATRTFTTDAALKAVSTLAFSSDAAVRKAFTLLFSTDAALRGSAVRTFTTDAALRAALVKSFTTDAALKKALSRTFETDSLLRKSSTATYTTDAALRKSFTLSFQSDAALRKALTRIFTTDAALHGQAVRTFTTDAYLQQTGTITKSFTTDALLHAILTRQFYTDALLRQTSTQTFTTDAALRKTSTPTFTSDALLRHTASRQFQTDALLRGIYTQSFTTDAALHGLATLTFSTDAYLRPFAFDTDLDYLLDPINLAAIPMAPVRIATRPLELIDAEIRQLEEIQTEGVS